MFEVLKGYSCYEIMKTNYFYFWFLYIVTARNNYNLSELNTFQTRKKTFIFHIIDQINVVVLSQLSVLLQYPRINRINLTEQG